MWLNKLAFWIECNRFFINVPNHEQKICMYSWWFTMTVVTVIQGMVREVLYWVLTFGWLILLMSGNNTVLSWPSGRLSWQLSACWFICLKESNLVTSDWNRLVYTISSPPFTGSPYTICEAHWRPPSAQSLGNWGNCSTIMAELDWGLYNKWLSLVALFSGHPHSHH